MDRPKVLVVDDTQANLEILSLILNQNYDVLTANNGTDGITLARKYIPDTILLDVMMPDIDGYEILNILKSEPATLDIPVIFITAHYRDIDRVVKGLELGALDYLTKPFENEVLIARVNAACRLKKSKDEIKHQQEQLERKVLKLEEFGQSIKNFTTLLQEYAKSGNGEFPEPVSLDPDSRNMAETFKTIIQQRNLAESSLHSRERELEQIVNNMVNGVITIDENDTILSFNSAAEKMFGYSSEEIIGRNINVLMTKEYKTRHNSFIKNYINTGTKNIIDTTAGRTVEAINHDGHIFPIHLSISELPKDINGKHRFIGSCLDVSQQQLQEEKLRRSQKMEALGKLTGGIAHDYNNMLGVILGFSELLELALSDKPKLLNYVEQIKHASIRGTQLTEKLLGFSRNKISESTVVNVNKLLSEQRYMLEKTLTPRISLTLDLEDGIWPISVDVGDFEDSILNICINSMHAMEDGGEIVITTRNKNADDNPTGSSTNDGSDCVYVAISDTGSGMSEETLAQVFDPFFSSKGEHGTGLGLSQVYGFIQRSNAHISVQSELNLGSEFSLYFPRHTSNNDNNIASTSEVKPILGGSETILIVDDEFALQTLMQQTLSLRGYNILAVDSAENALKVLDKQPVDLLISDVLMRGMDGYELANEVKTKYPNIKIQLISGYNDKSNKQSGNTAFPILQKPFQLESLCLHVRNILDS